MRSRRGPLLGLWLRRARRTLVRVPTGSWAAAASHSCFYCRRWAQGQGPGLPPLAGGLLLRPHFLPGSHTPLAALGGSQAWGPGGPDLGLTRCLSGPLSGLSDHVASALTGCLPGEAPATALQEGSHRVREALFLGHSGLLLQDEGKTRSLSSSPGLGQERSLTGRCVVCVCCVVCVSWVCVMSVWVWCVYVLWRVCDEGVGPPEFGRITEGTWVEGELFSLPGGSICADCLVIVLFVFLCVCLFL